jgi:hypothetical protein
MSRQDEVMSEKGVGVETPTLVVPEVEFLTRNDIGYGRWDIHGCEAVSGSPRTQVDTRQMFAPLYDDELSRHIRAHEMFHAKVSPTTPQMEKIWRKRGYAKDKSLIVCEELRVNTLLKEAGFEPEKYLKGGSERFDGENFSRHGDFSNAVMYSMAVRKTAGWQDYLDGIAVNKPEWVTPLTKFTDEACAFYEQVIANGKDTENRWRSHLPLHATGSKAQESGFGYTESLAKWIETIIDATQESKPEQGKQGEQGKEGLTDKQLKELMDKLGEMGEQKREQSKWGKGNIPKRGVSDMWGELRVAKPMLDKSVMGAIGRKKIASQTGKNPRRIGRLLSDPERRIFDRSVKGAGGVVLVDTSGSMSLSEEEVSEIVLNAPSALVAMYSGGAYKPKPNLWVIANKGRMCRKLPRPHGSNEVDGVALRWAVKQRQRSNSPIIWVSDGGVTGKRDAFDTDLVMDCIKVCKQHGIYVVPDPPTAIALLKKLKNREKVSSTIPNCLKDSYKEQTGHELVLR